MNERIKELLTQSGVSENWNRADWYSMSPAMVEKFAELIVQECLFIIDDERKPEMVSRIELWKQVKEHFGVEE